MEFKVTSRRNESECRAQHGARPGEAGLCGQRLLKEAEKMKGSNGAGLEQKNVHAMETARVEFPRAKRPCKEGTKVSAHTGLCYKTRLPFSRPHGLLCSPREHLSHVTDNQGTGT